MKDEMDSMMRNQAWKLVDLLPQHKSIENKWVFKIKHWVDGMIDKLKACLVVKEFTQIEGVDYEETFSPMVRIAFICLLLALVVHLDLELFQMIVKTTCLNSSLEKKRDLYESTYLFCIKRSRRQILSS